MKAAPFYLALLLLTSCGSSSSGKPNKQMVRLNIHSEPPSLDPRKATDATSINIIKMCFDGLMRLGRDGKPECALAKSFTVSDDGLIYTFLLREAKWSDGMPITSNDFEKTWKTILNPLFPSELAYELYPIKHAKAVKEGKLPLENLGVHSLDSSTLQIHLEHPIPHFPLILTSHSFIPMPSHIDSEHFVGSGPFKMKEWKHYYQITLQKNSEYWDADQVKLEEVELPIIEDESTELALFDKGYLDWAGSPLSTLPTDSLASLFKKKQTHLFPLSGVYYFMFNTKQFPFNHKKIRQAFSLALDRQSLIENVIQGNQLPATSLIPPTMWGERMSYFKDADTETAQKLFAEALQELGLSKENFPAVTLSFNTLSAHHKIAQAVQQQWANALGVRVLLENKEWKVFLDEVSHHQFQIARMGALASINDAADFLENYRYDSSNRNFPQWYHPKFSALLEKAEQTNDEKKRKSLLQQAEKILVDEMPVAPLYFYTGIYLKKPYVKGVAISDIGELDLKNAYIEEE